MRGILAPELNGGSVAALRCIRCGHAWYRRRETLPKNCPRCKSPYWDTGRVRARRASGSSTSTRLLDVPSTPRLPELSYETFQD
jgi:hypothetical protein